MAVFLYYFELAVQRVVQLAIFVEYFYIAQCATGIHIWCAMGLSLRAL
jgi:hypothetical protein